MRTESRKGHKPVLFLAGDSTVQSYDEEKRPQAGWGEALLWALGSEGQIVSGRRQGCRFSQEVFYDGEKLSVDNHAMAGRSSKTFRQEGRLEELETYLGEGDYLLIQFGHNDASAAKPERYVSERDFQASLLPYIQAAKRHGATPILLSSITLRPCQDTYTGEKGVISASLPVYGAVMEVMSRQEHIPYIDVGALTRAACCQAGEQTAKAWYMDDNIHLKREGANVYAGLIAGQLKAMMR